MAARPLERLKDRILILRRNASAGIFYAQYKHLAWRSPDRMPSGPNIHFTSRGIADGIAHQIGDEPAHAHAVGLDFQSAAAAKSVRQAIALLWAWTACSSANA